MKIRLNTIQNDDSPFLKTGYGSTRKDNLERIGWTEKAKSDFIEFQFNAQHGYYTNTWVKKGNLGCGKRKL